MAHAEIMKNVPDAEVNRLTAECKAAGAVSVTAISQGNGLSTVTVTWSSAPLSALAQAAVTKGAVVVAVSDSTDTVKKTIKPVRRLKLSWPGQYVQVTGTSFKDLTLELEIEGKVVDAVPAISGGPGRQNEPFLLPTKDWSGSNHPIPEGVYEIGTVAKGKFAPGIGGVWIPLSAFAEFKVNDRSAFGFHLDDNIATAPGSAGCVVFRDQAHLDRLLEWLAAKPAPRELLVDWRTGFLAEHGYETMALAGPTLTPTPVIANQVSATGLKLITHFEGCEKRRSDGSLEAYLDSAGVWTIGYGHTVGVTKGQVITQEQADAYLAEDLRKHEKNVRGLVKATLTQPQFDALVAFDFNVGALNVSTLLKLLNAGNYVGAANEFPRWNKAKDKTGKLVELAGLTRRRKSEQHLFTTGKLKTTFP